MIILSQRGVPFHPSVSRSSSGKIVAYVCRKFGYFPILGSADREGMDKGGTKALFTMLRSLKKGNPVAITVDGSIGPRRIVKPGIIDLARKTGANILPVYCVCTKYWELNTWDRLKIPKPFSNITIHYGHPVTIDKETKREDMSALQKMLGASISHVDASLL
ncbi:MAG: DUF374 domain-containing protein [Bdellovibrionota bacterium]